MTSILSARLLTALSIAYGLLVALIAVFAESALSAVAIVGALVVGGLWALKGVFSDRPRAD